MITKRIAPLPLLVLVAACSGAPAAAPSAPTGSPAEAAPGAAAASPTAAAAAPSAEAKAKPARRPDPTSVADCEAMATDPAAEAPPDDPTTAAGATGQSDRRDSMAELMHKKRPAFRCCFDVWAGKIPEAKLYTKVAFSIELDPAGKLKSSDAKPEQDGPAVSREVAECLSDIAGKLTYPASPSGKETTYRHHFDFKPHRYHH